MPTVGSFDGLRITIFYNDHRPAHVHVIGRGCEAVFALNCPNGPVQLRENYGFSRAALARIKRKLNQDVKRLCRQWERIHGNV